jgi:hypothetical protein
MGSMLTDGAGLGHKTSAVEQGILGHAILSPRTAYGSRDQQRKVAVVDGRWLTLGAIAALAAAGQVRQGSAAKRKWGSPPPKGRAPRRKPVGRHPLSWAPPEKKLVGVTEQGEPIWQTKRRERGKGAVVNPLIPLPKAPGPWVDLNRCEVCGQTYESFNSGVSFDEGVQKIRHAAGWQSGGGYRTPGPVLWAMRTIKAERWYLEHFFCGAQYGAHQAIERQRAKWQRQHARWQKQIAQWRARHPEYADPQLSAAHFQADPPPQEPVDLWAQEQPQIPF